MHSTHETPAGQCSACGERASAIWHGAEHLAVCHRCAIEVLPTLIADAISHPTLSSMVHAHDAMIKRFWEATAKRLLGEQDRKREAARCTN